MSISKNVLGAVGLAVLTLGLQLPTTAQTISIADLVPVESNRSTVSEKPVFEPIASQEPATENLLADAALEPITVSVDSADLSEPTAATLATEESTEIAQARRRSRRRTRNNVSGSDFIGIGGDFGYADDLSFAIISKLSLTNNVAIRPSVLLGDDLAVLVPVTYEFNQYSTDVGGFQFLPYAGVGASYQDNSEDDENINLLLSAGADVPLSQQFTLNAQANFGVLGDTDFGVTVGVGYNFGNIFGR